MAVSDRTMRIFAYTAAAAVAAIFVYHVAALLGFLGGQDSLQEGLVWSIVLMIFTPLVLVAVIGGGLARTVRHRRREAVETLLAEERGERDEGGSDSGSDGSSDGGSERESPSRR